jgi:hypothetical protein
MTELALWYYIQDNSSLLSYRYDAIDRTGLHHVFELA